MGKMKANRKFINGEDAVSAVIGVILMVAITVAIAATVYVYVSGMMTPVTTGKVMSATLVTTSGKFVQFKVTSADAGIAWSECKPVWANYTYVPTSANLTSIAVTPYTAMTGNVAVGQYFWIRIGNTGTYQVDIVNNGKIIWTTPAFVL